MSDDPSLKHAVCSDEEYRIAILMAMDTVLGRSAILGKTMELLRGRASPHHILKLIDEELKGEP